MYFKIQYVRQSQIMLYAGGLTKYVQSTHMYLLNHSMFLEFLFKILSTYCGIIVCFFNRGQNIESIWLFPNKGAWPIRYFFIKIIVVSNHQRLSNFQALVFIGFFRVFFLEKQLNISVFYILNFKMKLMTSLKINLKKKSLI